MCDPATMAIVSIGSTLASAGLGIAGQAHQAASQQAMFGYQARVAENNRLAAERLAVDAEQRGRVEESRGRMRTRALMGTQTAALAGQGTDLGGSPTDILGDTGAAGEAEALAVRGDAAREAWGYRTRGVEFGNEAALARVRLEAGGLGAASTVLPLIGSAGAVADRWYRYRV